MNINRIHKTRTATFATVIAFVACACASASAPAFAGETHCDGEGGAGANIVSPYAVPLTALDGLTLAQYIEKHQAGDFRTATVV